MKLALTSDTHYGHSKNTHRIHEKFLDKLYADMKANDVKALIHAGDWESYKQDQLKRTLLMFRKHIPDIPILGVRGNHDLWDFQSNPKNPKMGWNIMQSKHAEWFAAAGIHHLENNPYIIDDVIIMGFDGWYKATHPPTNDAEYMARYPEGEWCHVFHSHRAHKAFYNIFDSDISQYRAGVCVTHMPPHFDPKHGPFCANESYFDPIKEKFKVLCTGHSHHYVNEVQDGCLLVNCGSDYDKPKYLIFEV